MDENPFRSPVAIPPKKRPWWIYAIGCAVAIALVPVVLFVLALVYAYVQGFSAWN